jgi:hypothetical protein
MSRSSGARELQGHPYSERAPPKSPEKCDDAGRTAPDLGVGSESAALPLPKGSGSRTVALPHLPLKRRTRGRARGNDAKIGSLHTLLAHLPPLIEQPAFGQLRIANELRRRGLTVLLGFKRSASRFLVASLGPQEPARLGVRQLCSETRRLT